MKYGYCNCCGKYGASKELKSKTHTDYDYVKMYCSMLSLTIEKCQEGISQIILEIEHLKFIQSQASKATKKDIKKYKKRIK